MLNNINPQVCIVIVHGQTEKILVERLKSQFKLNIKIISNGKSSVQINGLASFINRNQEIKDCIKDDIKADDFTMYTIMDVDEVDIDKDIKNNYLNGNVSKVKKDIKNQVKIVALYNKENIEDMFKKITGSKPDSKNGGTTRKFITERLIKRDFCKTDLEDLRDKLLRNDETSNLHILLTHCLRYIDN